MGMTLAEYKKQTLDPLKAGVIQTFINHAPVLSLMGFENMAGGAISYNREKTLPAAAFRVIDAEYTADGGEVETVTESLKIVGGKISLDRALLAMYGTARRATAVMMKIKAIARTINATFFKGDGTSGSFTGLQSRIASGQVIANHATGAVLSLAKLDEAVLNCEGDNRVIFVGDALYLGLTKAMRNQTLTGNLQMTVDEFGMPVMRYAGIPVVRAGKAVDGSEVLDFSEASSTTSIYIVAFSPEGVEGVQTGEIQVIQNRQGEVVTSVEPEWYMNYLVYNIHSAIRLSKIIAGDIVA